MSWIVFNRSNGRIL